MLAKGKTYLIGVLFSSVNHAYIGEVVGAVQDVAWEKSYVPIFLTHNSCHREKTNIEALLRRRVDGLIVNTWVEEDGTTNTDLYEQLRERNVPMVEIFGRNMKGVASLNVDNRAGARMAVQRLVSHGHKSIAHFTHSRYNQTERFPGLHFNAWEFHKGYEEEMRANGLEPVTVTHELSGDLVHPGYAYGQALEAAPRLLSHPSAPTAVICQEVEAAEGLMHFVSRHAEATPHDFETVTFAMPGAMGKGLLTTHRLQLPMREIGAAAAEALLGLINGKPAHDILLAPTWGASSNAQKDAAGAGTALPSLAP